MGGQRNEGIPNLGSHPQFKGLGTPRDPPQGWRTAERARKRLRGSGKPPGRKFETEGGTLVPILHCGLARVAKKSYQKCTRKMYSLANAPQTPRRRANSTGKWRRPNKGRALAPAFKSRTTSCAPPDPPPSPPAGGLPVRPSK
jgi:hypothetical protein